MNSNKTKERSQTLTLKDVELIQSYLQHRQHYHTLPFYSYSELCTLIYYLKGSHNLDNLLNFFKLLHSENITMTTPLLSNNQLTYLIKELTDISLVYLLFNCTNITIQSHILTSLQKNAPIRYRMLKNYQNDYLKATISESIKTLPYTNLNLISKHLFNSKLTKNELNFISQELIKHHKKKSLLLYAHYCCTKMVHHHLTWKVKLDTVLAIFYILDSLVSKIDETKPIIKNCFTNCLNKIANLNDLNLLKLCLNLSPQLLGLLYDAIIRAKQSSDFEKRRRYSTLLSRVDRLSRTKNGGYLNVIFRQKHNSLN